MFMSIIKMAMSILRNTLCHVTFFSSNVHRLHVDFKKWPFGCIKFRGEGPHPFSKGRHFDDLILLSPSEIKGELCKYKINISQGID